MRTDAIRPAAAYQQARTLADYLRQVRRLVVDKQVRIDRAVSTLSNINRVRDRAVRRAASGGKNPHTESDIRQSLESAAMESVAVHKCFLSLAEHLQAAIDSLGDLDTSSMKQTARAVAIALADSQRPEVMGAHSTAVHAVRSWAVLMLDALCDGTREAPRADEHFLRAVVEDQRAAVHRITNQLPTDEQLAALFARANVECLVAESGQPAEGAAAKVAGDQAGGGSGKWNTIPRTHEEWRIYLLGQHRKYKGDKRKKSIPESTFNGWLDSKTLNRHPDDPSGKGARFRLELAGLIAMIPDYRDTPETIADAILDT